MKIPELLDQLIIRNIKISIQGHNLKIDGPEENISSEVIQLIKENKQAILAFLQEIKGGQHLVSRIPNCLVDPNGYVLSSSQRNLYLLCQLGLGSSAYNMCGVVRLNGNLNIRALDHAQISLMERHETLRTVFKENGSGEIRQFVQSAFDKSAYMRFLDLRSQNPGQEMINEILQKEIVDQAFDLANGPLFKSILLQVDDDSYIFMYAIHHIISDGWSMDIIIKELIDFYNQYGKPENGNLVPLRIHYKDYSTWERHQLDSGMLLQHRSYWKNTLLDFIPLTDVVMDKVRPRKKTFLGSVENSKLSSREVAELISIGSDSNATLYMCVVALVNILIFKYTGQTDIIVGTPVAGRDHDDLEDQIGFFVNTIPIRSRLNPSDSYFDILIQERKILLEAFKYKAYPLEDIIDDLKLSRNLARHPLFDVMVVYKSNDVKIGVGNQGLDNITVSNYEGGEYRFGKFDLTFTFSETEDGLQIALEYSTDILNQNTVKRLLLNFRKLVSSVLQNPLQPIELLEYIDDTEKQLIFSNSRKKNEKSDFFSLTELFRIQFKCHPDSIAVVLEDQMISYKELEFLSDALAVELLSNTKNRGHLIALLVERSLEMIIGVLAILKSGGIYLPLDVSNPDNRIEQILVDSQVDLVLTQSAQLNKLKNYDGRVILFDKDLDGSLVQLMELPQNIATEPAYVIYTSGSTGKPKGTIIHHGGIVNTILYHVDFFRMKQGEYSSQFASPAFDASISEIFTTLLSGGVLHIIPENRKKDPDFIEKFLLLNTISAATFPPAFLRMLTIEKLTTLRVVITGGESADPDIVNRFLKANVTYINAYGPTETSISTCLFEALPDNSAIDKIVPIGTPVTNTDVYILNSRYEIVPIGVIGEICVGGPNLALGYLNQAQITADKFVEDVYSPGKRLYKTGDLGKWVDENAIVFMGRNDTQVKIRGYRVEPEEIEHILAKHKNVMAATVVCVEKEQGAQLVAYVVLNKDQTKLNLKRYLNNLVPDYMVPEHIVELDELPVNNSGKIDKHRLPLPRPVSQEEFIAPRHDIEKKLAEIWSGVLSMPIDHIGATSNFFDLGGNSLNLIKAVSRIKTKFNFSVPVTSFYNAPTIEAIARLIDFKIQLSVEITYFNQTAGENIFCFPPIIGHGYCYHALAEKMRSYRFSCFSYNKADDPVNYYTDKICELQNDGEYILMGYSAGAIMLYPIAKELERRNKKISKIVILDGKWEQSNATKDIGWVHDLFDEKIFEFNLGEYSDEFYHKIRDYTQFISDVKFDSKLNSRIDVVISKGFQREDTIEELRNKKNGIQNSLAQYTSGSVNVFQGTGLHEEFLDIRNIDQNSEIILQIVKGIQ